MDKFRPELFRHPVWGEPIGITRRGKPFWLGQGASEPGGEVDAGAQGGAGGDGTTGQGAGTASTTTSTTDQGAEGAQGGTEADQVARAEFERIRQQLQAADKKRAEYEQKLKEIEDKDKGELEKATERATQLEQKVSTLEQEVTQLRLEKSMLSDPEYGAEKWHDPDDVLVRLNRAVKEERVALKDGEPDVASVKAFLKDLASKKAYLLKPSTNGNGATGKSGQQVGGGDRRTSEQDKTDEELKRRYRIR